MHRSRRARRGAERGIRWRLLGAVVLRGLSGAGLAERNEEFLGDPESHAARVR
jgi:hypothetical protein